MASPVTLRLDQNLRQRVERIAKRKKCTSSAAMREAIETWVQREESGGSFYDSIKYLVGVVSGGDPGRSTRRMSEELKTRRGKE
jgi:metal-responsive CopG/Arc/MetJ family transcriptional regulator